METCWDNAVNVSCVCSSHFDLVTTCRPPYCAYGCTKGDHYKTLLVRCSFPLYAAFCSKQSYICACYSLHLLHSSHMHFNSPLTLTIMDNNDDCAITYTSTVTIECQLSDLQLGSEMASTPSTDPRCTTFGNSVAGIHIEYGVVCYSGTAINSMAVYICDQGYLPSTIAGVRVCRNDGTWSGSTTVCSKSQ